MFLEKLEVKDYKRVKNLNLIFNKVEPVDNLRTTIIIGENGTAKTTIFEYIIKNFLRLIENGSINFEYTKLDYQENIRLIVSSYAAIDKLNSMNIQNNNRNYSERDNVELIKTSKVVGNFGSLINRIIELMYQDHSNKKENTLRFLLEYIGYKPSDIYLTYSKSKFKSIPALIRKSNLHINKVKTEWLEYPNADRFDIEYIQKNLNNCREELCNYYGYNFKNIDINLEGYYNQFSNNSRIDEIIGLNFLNILMKYKILFNLDSRPGHKINLNELVYRLYPGGEDRFFKDQLILNSLNITLWKDIAFEISEEKELINLSQLSSGELSIFIRLFDIAYYTNDNTILLIDEPETHLHPKWIKNYLPTLNEIVGDKKAHAIIATHSPLIVSDTINDSIILLKKEEDKIKYEYVNTATLGGDYNEVLENIFRVEDVGESVLKKYEDKILEYISEEKIEEALNLYLKIADDNLKMKLYRKLKENINYVEE
ncbi:MAG: AAA family ATPase [Lysinibacillus fusiformis]|nr:AAA family ATPase [Lysinibacillus fusiformis]MCT6929637.1 AAA family ATPase [Lysinibacillus fusiformis]MCT6934032.1 AAA family ATPase [Lysinibacillus fusiformis]